MSTPGPQGYGAESATTEARIHVVMDDDKIPGKKGTPQVVFVSSLPSTIPQQIRKLKSFLVILQARAATDGPARRARPEWGRLLPG